MFRKTEEETEILLGNKQLLSIFFVIAALLGLVFAAGYMVGRNSPEGKAVLAKAALAEEADSDAAQTPGETRTVPAEGHPDRPSPVANETLPETSPVSPPPSQTESRPDRSPLGAAKPVERPAPATAARKFTPQPGQSYLQVAAIGRPEADMLSDVLNRKGFRAHVTSGPTAKTFRVLVGPLKSAADIAFTRDDLVRKGFKGREAIIRRY